MLEALINILAGGATGGLVGVVGGLVRGWLDYKTFVFKAQHELKLAELDLRAEQMGQAHELAIADKQIQRSQVEGELNAEIAAQESFREGLKAQTVMYGGWVDQVRGMMRPVLSVYWTVAMSVLTGIVWFTADGIDKLTTDQLMQLLGTLLNAVVFLATTSVGWWFASRTTIKPLEMKWTK